MFHLPLSLNAWKTDSFKRTLEKEICLLDSALLPLQEGLQHSSYAIADNLSIMILNTQETSKSLRIKVGIFYTGVIAGCNCADDPTPVDEITEHCEVLFIIYKQSSETTVQIV